MPIVWIIIAIVIVLILVILVATYNRFVMLRARIDNAWAQVQVQLKRRWDLIPNLVETVKGYATHESKTLEAVVAARSAAVSATTPAESAKAESGLTGALRQLLAVAEAYPDLKANQNFMSLQGSLGETEDKISYARQFFNDTVMNYNIAIARFPGVIIANLFNFKPRESFEAPETEQDAPKVSFEGAPSVASEPAAEEPAAPEAPEA
ncbi:MAG: LemA family protein [Coriobacteriia bacterium]|nr:LemA family protein [Coriobacteriia bacterium]